MTVAYSYFPTASDLIKLSLAILRVRDIENSFSPSTNQITHAIAVLNNMLVHWQTLGMQIWARKTFPFTPNQGVSSYPVGLGATLGINRPLKIYDAWLHDTINGTDRPIEIVGEKEYYAYSNKTTEGSIISLYYDPRYEAGSNYNSTAQGTIYLYQAPDANTATNTTVYFRYQRPFYDFNASTDVLDFPQEWNDAIVHNLALRLAPVYGIPMLEYDRIKSLAKELLDEASGWDQEGTSLYLVPARR